MLLLALWALAPLGAAVDCHRVLGVERGADAAALKKAYRKRALETHPDRSSPSSAATQCRSQVWFGKTAGAAPGCVRSPSGPRSRRLDFCSVQGTLGQFQEGIKHICAFRGKV